MATIREEGTGRFINDGPNPGKSLLKMLDGSNIVQKYYRFISKRELKELKAQLEARRVK